MRKRYLWIGVGVAVLVPLGALAWWLLSPLLTERVVEEEFPFASSAQVPPGMTRPEVEGIMAGMAKVDQPMEEPMPPSLASADAGPGGDASGMPQVVKEGQFRDGDRFHMGTGRAAIYRGPGGSFLLRLEEFRVTNGPALHVILSPVQDPQDRDAVHATGYVDLGPLKGNVGSQNYPIPAGTDIGALNSVVIYCVPFHVIFSVAPLGGDS